jgi:hypothetical protein
MLENEGYIWIVVLKSGVSPKRGVHTSLYAH